MNLKSAIALAVLVPAALAATAPPLQAQACKDEKEVLQAMMQDLVQAVADIKKESEADFEAKYHRKACLNKLTFASGAAGDASQCLQKAGGDATAPADQQSAAKSEGESDAKLKERLSHYRESLKAAADGKESKTLIETFELSSSGPK